MLAFGLLLFLWRSSSAVVYQCCRSLWHVCCRQTLKPSNAPFWNFTVNVPFDSTIFFNVSILTHSSSIKSALNIKCVLFKCVLVGGQWQAMNINCPIGFIGHVVAQPDRAMSPRPTMDWNGLDAPSAFLINTNQITTLMKKYQRLKVYGGLLLLLCASLFLQHYHS